jgi:hypothetical protein
MSKNTNLSFLTDYITADITNGRIGINNASPTVAFDVTGVANFSSSITSTKIITSTTSDGDPQLGFFTNASTGTSAEAVIYIKNGASTNDATFVETTGTNFTTTGGFVQDGGIIGTGTTLAGGMSLMVRANADMRFYTNGHTNERMRIFANGNISIQDTFVDNGSKLNITSGAKGAMRILANATYDAISVGGTGAIRADYPGVGGGRFELNDAGTLYLRQYSNGTLSISSGQVVSSSDKNLKIEDGYINNALDKISKLTPTYFYWKEDSGIETNERQLGFFAQNVQEALGEEVANNNGNDKWGIYDRGIIAMLTKGIQELSAKVTLLENK